MCFLCRHVYPLISAQHCLDIIHFLEPASDYTWPSVTHFLPSALSLRFIHIGPWYAYLICWLLDLISSFSRLVSFIPCALFWEQTGGVFHQPGDSDWACPSFSSLAVGWRMGGPSSALLDRTSALQTGSSDTLTPCPRFFTIWPGRRCHFCHASSPLFPW